MHYNNIDVDKVWELRFVRNSSFTQKPSALLEDRDLCFYYAFDYYDKVICKRVDNMNECLGLQGKLRDADTCSPITSNYMTLVSLSQEQPHDFDPFNNEEESKERYPYLSLVVISVLADTGAVLHIRPTEDNIHCFLQHCIDSITEKVQAACEKYYNKKKEGDLSSHFQFRVLHSMNMGNFCVAVRADEIELGYCIAMSIKALEISSAGSFPSLHCGTFTITCIAQQFKDGIAVAPFYNQDNSSKSDIALRLAVSQDCSQRILSLPKTVGNGRGLYGRYDITITLTMNQFYELYPWIFAHKFGTDSPDSSRQEYISDPTVNELVRWFSRPSDIQCINERVLVNPDVLRIDDQRPVIADYLVAKADQINMEKNAINDMIVSLKEKGRSIPYYKMGFLKALDMVEDVWDNFENLRNQSDSFANGNLLFAQTWLLLDIVKTYLDSIDEKSRKRSNYSSLVTQFRKAVNSISRFHKMMQSINQQSMQAPNYEIQIHCDLEKLVIAYTEFSRRFLNEHFYKYTDDEVKKMRQLVLPICTVDSDIDSIQADALFLLPYLNTSSDRLSKTNPEEERLLLSISMPDIEVMGDLYHALPMICHEISHNFRVISRKERNDALCRFIIGKVASYVVRQWLSRSSDGIYIEFGEIQREIQRCIAEELFGDYIAYVKSDEEGDSIHETANIGVLLNNLLFFFDKRVFIAQDEYTASTPIVTGEMLVNVINELALYYQQYGDITKRGWFAEYQECIRILRPTDDGTNGKKGGEAKYTDEIKKRVIGLTKKMAIDIANYGLRVWINTESTAFLGFIRNHYILNDEEKDAFLELSVTLNKHSKMSNVPISPLEVDSWIKDKEEIIKNGGMLDRIDFKTLKRDFVGKGIDEEYEAKKAQLIHSWRELCRTWKNVSLLCVEAMTDIHTQHDRNIIFRNIRNKLQSMIKKMENNGGYQWTIFGAEKVQNYLLPLGIDQDREELFDTSLGMIMNSVPMKSVVSLVSDSARLYREIFADLGMCVSLGLDVFGYLMVFGTNKTLRGDDKYDIDDFGRERTLTVCWTLCKEQLPNLKSRSNSYYAKMVREIEKYLTDEGVKTDNYLELMDEVRNMLEGKERDGAKKTLNDYHVTELIEAHASIDVTRDKGFEKILSLFESLWFTSQYIWNYQHSSKEETNADLVQHFTRIYEDILSKDKFDGPYDSHVMKKIGEVYNNGELELDILEETQFKDTISFVICNYYQSWGIFGQGRPIDCDIKKWVNGIIGRSEEK